MLTPVLATTGAVAASAVIVALAYVRGSLSGSGALAATAVGAAVFGGGGWGWGCVLLTFFVSSSLLSRITGARKRAAAARAEKGERRDWAQVLANGGVAAALALASALLPGAAGSPGWWGAFVGALAAVTADTWATEIGTLSRARPRSILSLRPVEPGLSGGVTLLGLAASVAGGLAIGGVAAIVDLFGGGQGAAEGAAVAGPALPLTIGAVAGLLGSLADSVAGATLQALLRCEVCGALTEAGQHCGRTTLLVRGHRAFGNDAVNLLASLSGAAIGAIACLAIVIR